MCVTTLVGVYTNKNLFFSITSLGSKNPLERGEFAGWSARADVVAARPKMFQGICIPEHHTCLLVTGVQIFQLRREAGQLYCQVALQVSSSLARLMEVP